MHPPVNALAWLIMSALLSSHEEVVVVQQASSSPRSWEPYAVATLEDGTLTLPR